MNLPFLSPPLDLPLEKSATARFLPMIVALMVYLATLSLAVIFALSGLTARWDSELSGGMTVQVLPILTSVDEAEQQQEAMEKTVSAVLAVLGDTPGVASATRLSREDIEKLLEPWLGAGALVADMDLPALIDVQTEPQRPVNTDSLKERLAAIGNHVSLDDHKFWFAPLVRLAQLIGFIALVIVLCIGLVATATVVFTTRSGMAIHQDVIEILHMIGARDSYIARQFQYHVGVQALRGCALGFGLALASILLVGALAARIDAPLLPDFSLHLAQWALLALLPLAAFFLTIFTARLTVRRALARLL